MYFLDLSTEKREISDASFEMSLLLSKVGGNMASMCGLSFDINTQLRGFKVYFENFFDVCSTLNE